MNAHLRSRSEMFKQEKPSVRMDALNRGQRDEARNYASDHR